MEFIFHNLSLPNAVIICIFLLLFYIYGRWPFYHFQKYKIPGPEPIAYIGNMIDYRKPTGAFDLETVQKYGKVAGYYLGNFPSLLIADPQILKCICVREFANFTNRYNQFSIPRKSIFSSFLTSSKDDHWKFMRSVLAPTFSSRRMREMTPLIQKAIENLTENFENIAENDKEIDIVQVFSAYTMDVIASTAFGIEVNSQKTPNNPLVKHARSIFRTDFLRSLFVLFLIVRPSWLLYPLTLFIPSPFKKSIQFLEDFCEKVVQDRKQHKSKSREDLLQLMLSAQLETEILDAETEIEIKDEVKCLKIENLQDWKTKRGLKDKEVMAQSILFLIAGYETTSSALSFLAHSLALNPDIQEKLYNEIISVLGNEAANYDNVQKLPYLDMCMSETLRLYPIASRVNREAKKDICLGDWTIPSKTEIVIPIYAIHHLPEYWPDPEVFDPERFLPEAVAAREPFTYLPFGAGPRICAGLRLAHMELKMAMVESIRKYQFVPCSKTEYTVKFNSGIILSAQNGIWLKVKRRSNTATM